MITEIRSAILCDRSEQDQDGRVNYLGVHGDRVLFGSRPAALNVHAVFQLQTDRRASVAEVRYAGPDGGFSQEMAIPADFRLASVSIPIAFAVEKDSPFSIAVRNKDRPGWIGRYQWTAVLDPEAVDLPEAEAEQLRLVCRMSSRVVETR